MTRTEDIYNEESALGFTAVIYYAVLLVAFVIGMYGLFNLIWLAGSAVEQNAYVLTTM